MVLQILVFGNYETVVTFAEHEVESQKLTRESDCFLTEVCCSKFATPLPVPKNISKEQAEKWEILNAKINVAIDNHLRDIRPSSKNFRYTIDIIKRDAKTFINAFSNLLNKRTTTFKENIFDAKKHLDISYEDAVILHSLFNGENAILDNLDMDTLNGLYITLNKFCENLIRDPNSHLLKNSYYRLYLADALLNSKQNYQAIYYSMAGIRPRNTAYGHSVCDIGIVKTSKVLINEYSKRHEFNDDPFTFDKNDSFLIDQGGGNFISFTPMNNNISQQQNEDIVDAVNSKYTDEETSTFKIASFFKNNVNRLTIPTFVHSTNKVKKSPIEMLRTLYQILTSRLKKTKLLMSPKSFEEINSYKPFVQFARKLKELCNEKKDSIKVDSLEENINRDSIQAIFDNPINFYLTEIDGASCIENQKVLLENVMLALSNHEVYVNAVNEMLYMDKLNKRKIFRNFFKSPLENHDLEEEK